MLPFVLPTPPATRFSSSRSRSPDKLFNKLFRFFLVVATSLALLLTARTLALAEQPVLSPTQEETLLAAVEKDDSESAQRHKKRSKKRNKKQRSKKRQKLPLPRKLLLFPSLFFPKTNLACSRQRTPPRYKRSLPPLCAQILRIWNMKPVQRLIVHAQKQSVTGTGFCSETLHAILIAPIARTQRSCGEMPRLAATTDHLDKQPRVLLTVLALAQADTKEALRGQPLKRSEPLNTRSFPMLKPRSIKN